MLRRAQDALKNAAALSTCREAWRCATSMRRGRGQHDSTPMKVSSYSVRPRILPTPGDQIRHAGDDGSVRPRNRARGGRPECRRHHGARAPHASPNTSSMVEFFGRIASSRPILRAQLYAARMVQRMSARRALLPSSCPEVSDFCDCWSLRDRTARIIGTSGGNAQGGTRGACSLHIDGTLR
jgi:hypothetical protein